ncbi:MAG: phage Gp37/Gp68 family protein, partial [Qingshengfaniella sp.]
ASRSGLTRESGGRPKWTGEVRLNEQWLDQPLRWRKPRMIFVCAHGDLFHESVPDEWIDQVFAVMALAPQHTFQVLTKRPDRAEEYLIRCRGRVRDLVSDRHSRCWPFDFWYPIGVERFAAAESRILKNWPLPNVWIGTSASDQASADLRIPQLLQCPAALRFVSLEPLLGPVDLTALPYGHAIGNAPSYQDSLRGKMWMPAGTPSWPTHPGQTVGNRTYVDLCRSLDWVIVGGESGRGARPMHPDWARALRDQCAAAAVPFFFKQWGEWTDVYDRDRDDPDWRHCDTISHATPTGRWMNLEGGTGFHGDRVIRMVPTGKKNTGRQLDGREWNEVSDGQA